MEDKIMAIAEMEKMELTQEQMEQVFGSAICSGVEPALRVSCRHPNAVKTSIGYEDEFFIFWTRHRCAYLCPDCHEVVWVFEDP